MQRHRSPALTHPQVELQQVSLPLNTQPAFQSIIRTLALDLGEQAALSLMARFPDAIFLTDDAAARLAANTLGYKVHGTIGILLRAIRRQQRSRNEVLETLRAIPTRSTLHVRQQFLNEIIDEVEQHE